jgi:hypothetical protein
LTFRIHTLGHGPREPNPQTNPKGNPTLNPYWDNWWDAWRQILEREVRDKLNTHDFDQWLMQQYTRGGEQLSSGTYCIRWQWLIYRDRAPRAYLFPAFAARPYNGGIGSWQSASRRNELELYTRPLVERALRQVPPFPTLPTSGDATKAWGLEQDLILNWNREGPGQIYAGERDEENRRRLQCPGDGYPLARGLLFD